jgi:hypothetical protein
LLASTAPEALWVVCSHPSWHKDPALTSFLTAQLATLPSNDADDRTPTWIVNQFLYPQQDRMTPGMTWEWCVLSLAGFDDDPDVQKLLVDRIQSAIDKSNTPAIFLCNAFYVICQSKNPDIIALAAPVMARLASFGGFPDLRVFTCLPNLIRAHPELIKDPDFDKSAISFVRETHTSEDKMLLARFGDQTSFADVMTTYFNSDAFAEDGANQKSMRQGFVNSVAYELLPFIVYSGSGDKAQSIKEHYRSAVFQDGHWIVSGDEGAPSTPISSVSSAPVSQVQVSSPSRQPPPPLLPVTTANASPGVALPTPSAQPNTIPASSPALPDRVTVTARVPIETLDATGQVTAVAMATTGAVYHVIRADGNSFIVKDAAGTQYRISSQATASSP